MNQVELFKISEVELLYRRKAKACDRPKIVCSKDAYALFRQNWDDCKINLLEQFKILLLDRGHRCMGIAEISQGGVSGTIADPKIIFATALKARACAIILGHNHPSENNTPSNADIQLTTKMVEAGKYLELPVLDHLIITNEDYFSIADEGLLP